MRIFEIILSVLFAFGLFLKLISVPGGAALITLSLLLLSMFYFLFSFSYFNKIKLKNIFNKEYYKNIPPAKIIGTIGFGLGLSILLTGILYKIMDWPGGNDMNVISGLIIVSIIFIVSIIKFLKTKSKFYFPIFIRYTIWTIISILTLYSII